MIKDRLLALPRRPNHAEPSSETPKRQPVAQQIEHHEARRHGRGEVARFGRQRGFARHAQRQRERHGATHAAPGDQKLMRAGQWLADADTAQQRHAYRQDAEPARDGGGQCETQYCDIMETQLVQQIGRAGGSEQKNGGGGEAGLVFPQVAKTYQARLGAARSHQPVGREARAHDGGDAGDMKPEFGSGIEQGRQCERQRILGKRRTAQDLRNPREQRSGARAERTSAEQRSEEAEQR